MTDTSATEGQSGRVIIVGSGFSSQLSIEVGLDPAYPTIAGFWSFAKQHADLGGSAAFWDFHERIKQSLGSVPDVEQLLDMVQLAIQDSELLWVAEHPFEPAVIKKQLLFTITTALSEPLKQKKSDPNFLKPVGPIWEKLGGKSIDAVINFNWDTLLDEAWFTTLDENHRMGVIDPKGVAYALPRCWIRNFPNSYPEYLEVCQSIQSRTAGSTVHLKLHGSLNWRICTQGHIIIDEPKVGEDIRCLIDHSRTEYFIVPPSTVKDYSDSALSTIWKDASERLVRAREIIIYGFSVRPADYAARNLILTSFLRSEAPKNLTIIDKNPASVKRTLFSLCLEKKIAACKELNSWTELEQPEV